MTLVRFIAAIGLAGLLAAACGPSAVAQTPCTLDRATGTTVDKEPFLRDAYGARWNAATNRIALMRPNAKGYYQIFTVAPDGSRLAALTGSRLPADKHLGAPYWHPSGRYILFEAEKSDWSGRALFGSPDYEALPGFGRHCDLWLMTADGSRAWQLTNDPNTRQEGVLIPVFSPDGRHIAWGSRQPDGRDYVLKVADFVETPQPHLENIKTYEPGGAAFHEPGSFTSDSRSLAYTGSQETSFWSNQIFLLDLATGESRRLTTGTSYNEHPVVVGTPTGDWIVYMSDKGVDRYPGHMPGTDWWAVRPDGAGTKRLTRMNINREDNPENMGAMQVACTVAVSPTGLYMLGDVQDSLVKQTGLIRVIRFTMDK